METRSGEDREWLEEGSYLHFLEVDEAVSSDRETWSDRDRSRE